MPRCSTSAPAGRFWSRGISGGNPNLARRQPPGLEGRRELQAVVGAATSRLSSNFTRTVIDDAVIAFPTITPDLEAALPERFTRDAGGNLIALDARPLNFARTERSELRTGFNFSRAFGTPNPAAAGGPGGLGGFGGRGGPGAGGGAPRTIVMGGPPPGGGGGGPPRRRWSGPLWRRRRRWRTRRRHAAGPGPFQPVDLSHGPLHRFGRHPRQPAELDLLDGDATGGRGGTPRTRSRFRPASSATAWARS